MADQIALEFVPLVDQFLERVRQLARDAEQALLPLQQGEQLRLDISQAEGELTALREQLVDLGASRVSVRFDDAQAEEALSALRTRLLELQEVALVAVDPAPAVAALEEIATATTQVAAGLAAVGAAATEVGPEVAAGTEAAAPGLVNISGAAYKAALAVDSFARQAAAASEITPALSLAAGRAATTLDELEVAMKQAATQGGPVSPQQIATLQALVASLQAAQGQVNALAAAQQNQAGAAGQAAAATQGAGAAAAGAGTAAGAAAGGVNALNNSMRTLISTSAFYLGMRVARAFSELVSGSLDAKEAMERVNAAFERSRVSGAAAAGELDLVRQTADRLGLNFQQVAEHYGKFTDTLKGSEVPVRTQQNLLLGVATALAATRRPAEDAGQAFEIFSRLAARDETQVRQLASALNTIIPGSMRIAAEALFKGEDSLARFEAAAKKGQVSSLDFLEVIGPAYIRQFQDQLPGAVDSTTASLNRLKNAEFDAQVGIGEGFAPEIHRATEEFRAFLDTAGDTPRAIGEVVAAFVWLGTKAGEVVGSTVKLVGAIAAEATGGIYEVFAALAVGLSALAKVSGLESLSATFKGVERDWNDLGESFIEEGNRMLGQSLALSAGFLGIAPAAQHAGAGLDDLKKRGQDFEGGINEQVSAIERQVTAIERQADAIGRTGPVAREAADDIVKSIDKELKAIQELPQAEQRALAARTAILDQLRGHYEVFTTAYARLLDKQGADAEKEAKREAALLKQREDAVVRFYQRIQAEADKATNRGEKTQADLQKKLLESTSGIADIQAKPEVSVEDLNHLDKLREDVRTTEAELKTLKEAELAAGNAAGLFGTEAQQAGEKMREGFQKAIASDDVLRGALAQLGPASRDAFAQILENLVQLKTEGKATEAEIQIAGQRMGQVFKEAGVGSDSLVERLGLVTHSSQTLRDTMASLKAPTDAATGAARELAAANQAGAAAATQAGNAHRFNAEAQKEAEGASRKTAAADQEASSISIKRAEATSGLNEQLRIKTTVEPQLAGEIDKVTTAEQKAAEAQHGATAGTMEFRGHIVELSQAAGEAAGPSGGFMKMGDKLVHVGTAAKDTGKAATDLKAGVDGAAGSMDHAATAAEHVAGSVGSAGAKLIDFNEAAKSTEDATSGIGDSLKAIADGAKGLPAILSAVDVGLGQIVALQADAYFERLEGALVKIGPAARDALAGLKELAKFDFKALRDGFSWVEPTAAGLKKLVDDLKQVVELLKQVKLCQDALKT